MEAIHIEIAHEGKIYVGELSSVFGRGIDVYHLMVDRYYWGRLRKTNGKWVFDPTPYTAFMEPLATDLGKMVEGKLEDFTPWEFELSTDLIE